jgi:ATP synthase protein I
MKGMKSFGRYGSLGFELLGSIAVGYYLGVWLDKKAGTHWIAFAGFLLGCYAGFRALFKAAKTMQRDIENDERLARGEDPWAPKQPKDDDDDDRDDRDDRKETRNGDDAKR